MKPKTESSMTTGIACLMLATMMTVPNAAAVLDATAPADEGGAAIEIGRLNKLAILFSEAARAVPRSSGMEDLECGQPGHCNSLSCDFECPDGQRKSCTCSPTSTLCKDKHTWWDPFDDDEHNMYECNCKCLPREPDPPSGVCVAGVICVGDEVEVEDCKSGARSLCLPEPDLHGCMGSRKTRMECDA